MGLAGNKHSGFRRLNKNPFTFFFFYSACRFPVCKDLSEIILIMEAISSHSSFSRRGSSLSGPAAFPGLRFLRIFSSPFREMLISGLIDTGF